MEKQEQKQKEQSLEEAFQELEAIIEKMQNREVTLEESFSLYEQGIHKLKFCNEKIDRVEKQMLTLNQEGELEIFENTI
ncbi:exodeoxyribonuclease VII small subunit [Lachnospiraceae bacterium 66-29]